MLSGLSCNTYPLELHSASQVAGVHTWDIIFLLTEQLCKYCWEDPVVTLSIIGG